jgi:hypothetical protein
MRRPLLLFLASLVCAMPLRLVGCIDICDQAVDHCLECDYDRASCDERFARASDDVCERAVDEYRLSGCDPYDHGDCESDPEPYPQ